MIRTIEQTTMRKVYLRVLPIAAVSYFFCYLDRINVGFAALTMNKDLGLDAATFGFAAGIFFWGYFLFEVPSNIILEKLGARIWIARIMVTWGLLSGATAFCTGPYSFMTVRFLLGLAEAGFYPGLVLFFTYWFPDRHRARIVSGFTLAGRGGGRRAAFDRDHGTQRPVGPRRLEMDVPARSNPDDPSRHRRADLRDRSARPGALAQRRGTQPADFMHWQRSR